MIQGRLSFRADKEVGWLPAQDRLSWNVSAVKRDDIDEKNGRGRNVLVNGRVLDSSGKVLRRTEDTIKRARDENGAGRLAPLPRVPLRPESLMIAIEPRDNQSPEVLVHSEVTVDEGATEILSPDIISVNDSDTRPGDLVVVINDGPKHGYLEVRDRSGENLLFVVFVVVFLTSIKSLEKPTHKHKMSCCYFLPLKGGICIVHTENKEGRSIVVVS